MRTFWCFTTEEGCSTPTLSIILAETEQKARELARRELWDALRPVAVEVCEDGEVLWREQAARAAA